MSQLLEVIMVTCWLHVAMHVFKANNGWPLLYVAHRPSLVALQYMPYSSNSLPLRRGEGLLSLLGAGWWGLQAGVVVGSIVQHERR